MERAPFTSIPDHRPGKAARAGAAALYVALSATALAAVAYFESVPVRAASRGGAEVNDGQPPAKATAASAAAARPAPLPAKARAAGDGAKATTTARDRTAHLASTSAAAASAAETPAPAQAALTVPSFRGKRLSEARREGQKLGLVVSARDEEGERVPSGMARYYRVRRQLTKAGTPVEAGAAIELRVAEDEAAEGY